MYNWWGLRCQKNFLHMFTEMTTLCKWKTKPSKHFNKCINNNRVYALICPAATQIYWTKEGVFIKKEFRAVFIRVSKSNWFCIYYATRLA